MRDGAVQSLRERLWDSGFRPLAVFNPDVPGPSPGKRPVGDAWQERARRTPPAVLNEPLRGDALNTGLLADGLRPVDVDVDDPVRAHQVRALAIELLGEAPIRQRRNSPRCLLIYRAAQGQPHKRILAGAHGKVEVLGRGQQFVAFGRHESGAELQWVSEAPGDVSSESLPTVTEEQIDTFFSAAAEIIGAEAPSRHANDHNAAEQRNAESRPNAKADEVLDVVAALAIIPNDGPPDWEFWNRIGMATWAATGGSSAGFAAWCAWSEKHSAHNLAACRERWQHYPTSPPSQIGVGSLFKLARDARSGWTKPSLNRAERGKADTQPPLLDPWHALQPPAFPIDVLPPVLRAFIEDRAEVIGADPCAIAWAAISAASAALDGRIRLQMKRHDGWKVPPFIWLALIGAPSTKKTPILEAAWAPLHHAQDADLHSWQAERGLWSALPKKTRGDTPEPQPKRRLVSHDATIESIQDILGRQDRGLGIIRDELAGFIGSFEKYTSGRGSAADRAFYLQAYNGAQYVVDRVSRGTVAISNLGLTMAGGVQPDRLQQLGDLTSDGLWQRFLPIIVAPASLGSDSTASSAVADYTAMIDCLLQIKPGTLQLSNHAQDAREAVARRISEIEQSEALGPAFSAFCGKLHGVWGRLCLVLSQIAPDPRFAPAFIQEPIAHIATALLFQSVLPNASRVYASMGGAGGNMEATRSVAGFILTKRKTRIVASDLTNNVRACRGQQLDRIQQIVSPLIAGGWLAPEQEFNPTSWVVHPYVHERFAERAEQEKARRATIRALIAGDGPEGAEG